ncbi:putative membrane protein [Photobacterium leiognathi lrivu.4.1]|uniref:Putative membrane protein n=1 Tax=Photobacterium leiognathi lrivu.4.1 TaxID=1248232 RepID=X0NYT6_PHOLE|nr:putative membrane protein [Photobacterium leiognathi lrivu.4.1]
MLQQFLVRLTIATLVILGFKISAIYFLLVVLLLNTHHKEIFGW